MGTGFKLSLLLGLEARRVGEGVMEKEGKGAEKEAKITPSASLPPLKIGHRFTFHVFIFKSGF